MKLTLSREETKTGLIFKKTCYMLETNLELEPAEQVIMKKHGWDRISIGEATFIGSYNMDKSVGGIVGKSRSAFDSVECLAYYEHLVVEAARELKSKLERVSSFATGGPVEVDL